MAREPRILSSLLNAMGRPALIFDGAGLVVCANEDFARVTGRAADDLEGEITSELCHAIAGSFTGGPGDAALVRAAHGPVSARVCVRDLDVGEGWSLLVLVDTGADRTDKAAAA